VPGRLASKGRETLEIVATPIYALFMARKIPIACDWSRSFKGLAIVNSTDPRISDMSIAKRAAHF